ncbi:MAG: outer membrane beta-barrel protein, partial [Gallionella sp.]
ILQARNTRFKYQTAAAQKWNSTQQQYMVGVKWDATAKTSGSFKVGKVGKSFDSGTYATVWATAWAGHVTWSPLTYSVVNFELSQKAAESFNTGSFMISRNSKIDWRHEWSARIKSNLMFDDGTNTFQATAQINKRQTYRATLSYAVNRWLNAGLEYKHTQRHSTDALFNYTQSLSMLVLDGTL